MTRNKSHAFVPALALAACVVFLAGFSSKARAQGTPSPSSQTQKILKTHFVVVHMFPQSLQVSSPTNPRELHTFSYSPNLRDKLQQMFNAGAGYQYGDKVTVWYRQNPDVALKVTGKPSKPH